ncbi:phosphatidylinositol N-acetylglucosaminyltransferase subunit H-like [Euwallacea similis]|uniref:phosphatidylinositol N-acetylglucosaminyltransferase subunit H-like n=1 Tax=Euwallacea similis TaxID=1736056 RepID=UPI00344C828A
MQEDAAANFTTLFRENIKLNFRKTRGCLYVSLVKQDTCLSFQWAFWGLICTALAPIYLTIALITIYCIYWGLFFVTEENVLIVKGMGLQISKNCPLRQSTEFIPFERVENVFVNEVILRQRVVFMLTLLVKDCTNKPKLYPLFKDLLPRLDCIELIYRQIKGFKFS